MTTRSTGSAGSAAPRSMLRDSALGTPPLSSRRRDSSIGVAIRAIGPAAGVFAAETRLGESTSRSPMRWQAPGSRNARAENIGTPWRSRSRATAPEGTEELLPFDVSPETVSSNRCLERRKCDAHRQPLAVRSVRELNTGPVSVRDGLYDGEAEPATGWCGAGAAIEAVEHASALGRRDARPVVGHRQAGASGRLWHRSLHAQVDAAAGRGVTHRVVHQVTQQR